jgi:hypothetical protein
MALKQTIEVLNRMEADGVIGRYCISGAVASFYYVEATATDDLDILVSFEEPKAGPGLVTLVPIVKYLNGLGYSQFEKEGIVIEGWPVQFLPVTDDLDAEALASARTDTVKLDGGDIQTRFLRPEHIVAIALRTGRPKDRQRVLQFLEAGAVEADALCSLLPRHGLSQSLAEFCRSFGFVNPCGLQGRP